MATPSRREMQYHLAMQGQSAMKGHDSKIQYMNSSIYGPGSYQAHPGDPVATMNSLSRLSPYGLSGSSRSSPLGRQREMDNNLWRGTISFNMNQYNDANVMAAGIVYVTATAVRPKSMPDIPFQE